MSFAVRVFSIFLFAVTFSPVYAQEQLGMRLERYSGLYGAAINPANTAFNPNNWEINLFNAQIFVENSYAFLQNTSLPKALRNSDKIFSIADASPERPIPDDAIVQDFFDRDRNMHGALHVAAGAPGFSFRFKTQHTLGLVSNVRSSFAGYDIPSVLRYSVLSTLPRFRVLDIDPVNVNLMNWGEIGLHYSYRNDDYETRQFAIGVTPKYLMGFEALHLRAAGTFDYSQQQGDTVAFARADWRYAFTTGNLNSDQNGYKLQRQGAGMGIDLGFVLAQRADDAANETDYAWKIGASLLDLGFIRFAKSAQRHRIRFDSEKRVSDADFPGRDNAQDIINDLSTAFLGTPDASLTAESFSMALPAALSLQGELRLRRGLYVNALLIQRIPMGRIAVYRPNTLALTPRFEHKWFSFSLPVVLNDWRSVRMGAAGRLAFLHFGTDNLGSFFTKAALTGTDFYIGLKINGFRIPLPQLGGGGKRSSGGGGSKMGKIKCYKF